MSNPGWKDIAETIGITAIVASLIFVGLQMKQSHEIALAAQYHARAEAVMSFHETQYEVGSIPNSAALRAGLSDTVKPRDVGEVLWLWIAYDNHHFQYQSGFMSEDSWQGQLNGIVGLYNECEMRFAWQWRKQSIRLEFVDFVDSLDDACN